MKTTAAYRSASELVAGLASGELSSRDLLEEYVARIQRHNPRLNAVVAQDLARARQAADKADAQGRRGDPLGALHGLPLTIKDTYEVPGMPCTAGNPQLRTHRPTQPAVAVRRLQEAGAIVFAKTNVPCMASDIQSYNAIYGTTRNPWNTALTPGGSSGGAAVALAAGFTPLELGSDIGGSIRIPAHFCGVYGHKASYGIIPTRGHIPGRPGQLGERPLSVAGPMARYATDLQLMLEVLATAGPAMLPGWQLNPPAPHPETLQKFRVLFWTDDSSCPIDSRMTTVYTELMARLKAAGVELVKSSPKGVSLDSLFACYAIQLSANKMAGAALAQRWFMGMSAPILQGMCKYLDLPRHADKFYKGAALSYAEWLVVYEAGLQLREAFVNNFEHYDVILTPPTLTTAFSHDQSHFMSLRRIRVDSRYRHYTDMFMWIAPATLMGLPATSAPVGLTSDGLPVNVQIIGAPYADKTTIRFAELLAEMTGGFHVPPLNEGGCACNAQPSSVLGRR